MPSMSDNLRRMSRYDALKALSILLLAGTLPFKSFGNVCVYEPPTVGHFRGKIMDLSDYPVPKAQVRVMRGEEIVRTFTTGESGEFNFDSLANGSYQVDVRAKGFQGARYMVKLSSHKNSKRVLRITLGTGALECQGSIGVEEQTLQH